MTRLRIVEGVTTIITKGEHHIFSDGNINISSLKSVSIKGDKGINYGSNPMDAPDLKLSTPLIIKGYWTDDKGNKIQKASLEEKVSFHIYTQNIKSGEKVELSLFEKN